MFIQSPLKLLGTSASHIRQLSSRSSEHGKRGGRWRSYLPRSQWKQRSRPLLPLPHEQDRAAGWARPYSSASLIRRPPSPTASWPAASLVTSSCKKYTINRQTVSEVHFHSNRSLKLTEIHTSNEVTKILKCTTWCRIMWYIIATHEPKAE